MKAMIKGVSTFSALGSCLTLGVTAAGESVETTLPAAAIPLYAVLFFFCVLTGCGAAFLLTKIIRPHAKTSSGTPVEMAEMEVQPPPEDTAMVEEQVPLDDPPPTSEEDRVAKPSSSDEIFDYPDFS